MYNLYFFCYRLIKKNTQKNNKIIIFLKFIIGYIEAYFNLVVKKKWQKCAPSKLNCKKRDKRIIVSLTSYPKRIDTIWITIMSIFKQNMRPDEVILWLANSQFKSINTLPNELKRLQKYGLKIRFCDDLKSHKKYFYALQEYKNDLVILIDDDMFYPKDMIRKLYKMHKKYPNDICTMSAQKMNSLLPSKWTNIKIDEKYEHSTEIQVFTGSGSLYPGNCLYKDAFNKDLIEKLSPFADDLWITYMALKKGTKITCYHPWRSFPITIYGTSEDSLWYINGLNNQNDQQWRNIIEYYEGRD